MDPFDVASIIVGFARLWLVTGLAVAVAFLAFGIERVDPGARGSWAFRALLLPGIVLIWPIVLWRWAAIHRHGRG